jgi:transcriptional regulator with XRE-family HTH domain
MSGQTQKTPLNTSLRELRKHHGWTQAEVAEALGVIDLTVRRWEQGQAMPSAYHVKKLCDLFGKSPEELGLLQLRKHLDACGKLPAVSSSRSEAEPRHILQIEVPEEENFAAGETEPDIPSTALATHAPYQICLMVSDVFVHGLVFVGLFCLSLVEGILLALQAVTSRARKLLLRGSRLLSLIRTDDTPQKFSKKVNKST